MPVPRHSFAEWLAGFCATNDCVEAHAAELSESTVSSVGIWSILLSNPRDESAECDSF